MIAPLGQCESAHTTHPKYLVFTMNDADFCADVRQVQAILRAPASTTDEVAPAFTFEGRRIPLVIGHQCVPSALPPGAGARPSTHQVIVVFNVRARMFGLLVDNNTPFIGEADGAVEPYAAFAQAHAEGAESIRGMRRIRGRWCVMLDMADLMARPAPTDATVHP